MFANTIEGVSQIHFKSLFDASRGFSNALTSEAIALNMTFPFVTFSNFEVFGRQARLASKVEVIGFAPRIENTQLLAQWNEYALQNEHWVDGAHRIEQQIDPSAPAYQPFRLSPFVYDLKVNPETNEQTVVPPSGEGPFTPVWMVSPPPLSPFLIKVNTLGLELEGVHHQKGVSTILGM